jgi:hypothetical protein
MPELFELSVYDRWGALIFYTKTHSQARPELIMAETKLQVFTYGTACTNSAVIRRNQVKGRFC